MHQVFNFVLYKTVLYGQRMMENSRFDILMKHELNQTWRFQTPEADLFQSWHHICSTDGTPKDMQANITMLVLN